MNIQLFLFVFVLFEISSCIKGPAGPTGPSGTDPRTDPSTKPRVIWTFPPDSSVGPIPWFSEQISIRFNKLLDYSTVKRSMVLSPVSGYAQIDSDNISFIGGDFITFIPHTDSAALWDIGQTYTVTVTTDLRDVDGNAPESPYSFVFTPEPVLRVVSTDIKNGATNVSVNRSILFLFNNAMSIQSLQSSLKISPPTDGVVGQVGDLYASFQHTSPFPADTLITLVLDTTARDIRGKTLSKPFVLRFTTGSK